MAAATIRIRQGGAPWALALGAILVAWAGLYALVSDGWLCGAGRVAALPLGGWPVLTGMWALMAAAMMLPTLGPTLAAWTRLPTGGSAGLAALLAGYLAVWVIASAGFAAAQARLMAWGWVTSDGALLDPRAAAFLLIGAGAWQMTRVKTACQTACLTPEARLIAQWRPGPAAAFGLGARTGIDCFGCCWALMALGFVGGIMSPAFMGLATVFMVLEKVPRLGLVLRRPAGAALIAAGLWTLGG